jgi:DNA-binding IclR family transcriptional regulator
VPGWGCNVGEGVVGACSVGAPLGDVTGQVVAALSVAGPTARLAPELPAITHAVVEAAAAASRRLGHRSRGHE